MTHPSSSTPTPNTPEPPKSFIDRLEHEVRMRPRWWFWVRNIGIAATMTLLATLIIFAIGNAVFTWHSRELGGAFMARGPEFGVVVRHFPWAVTIVSFIGVVGLLALLRRFSASYRLPTMILLGVVVIGAGGLAILSTYTPIHGSIANRALRPGTPFFFRQAFRPDVEDGMATTGEITAVENTTSFTLMTRDDMTITVTTNSSTREPQGYTPMVHDRVLVIGSVDDHKVTATAIHPFHFRIPPPSNDTPFSIY